MSLITSDLAEHLLAVLLIERTLRKDRPCGLPPSPPPSTPLTLTLAVLSFIQSLRQCSNVRGPVMSTLALSLLLLVPVSYGNTREVYIEGLGSLLGTVASTEWTDRPIYQFQGIPYATPPLGPLRFKVSFCFQTLYICK